jgi:hypothetical protein
LPDFAAGGHIAFDMVVDLQPPAVANLAYALDDHVLADDQ